MRWHVVLAHAMVWSWLIKTGAFAWPWAWPWLCVWRVPRVPPSSPHSMLLLSHGRGQSIESCFTPFYPLVTLLNIAIVFSLSPAFLSNFLYLPLLCLCVKWWKRDKDGPRWFWFFLKPFLNPSMWPYLSEMWIHYMHWERFFSPLFDGEQRDGTSLALFLNSHFGEVGPWSRNKGRFEIEPYWLNKPRYRGFSQEESCERYQQSSHLNPHRGHGWFLVYIFTVILVCLHCA